MSLRVGYEYGWLYRKKGSGNMDSGGGGGEGRKGGPRRGGDEQ